MRENKITFFPASSCFSTSSKKEKKKKRKKPEKVMAIESRQCENYWINFATFSLMDKKKNRGFQDRFAVWHVLTWESDGSACDGALNNVFASTIRDIFPRKFVFKKNSQNPSGLFFVFPFLPILEDFWFLFVYLYKTWRNQKWFFLFSIAFVIV